MDQENTQLNPQQIDLHLLLSDFLSAAKQTVLLGVLLVIFAGALLGYRAYHSYVPLYRAEASFTVTVTNPLYSGVRTYNAAAAEQLAKTFPAILSSGALSDLVKEQLGTSYIPPISASVLTNTNIFTLSVTSQDAQFSYDVLTAVIDCYPEISEFVVGPTLMTLLSESGVPTTPYNTLNVTAGVKRGAMLGAGLWVVVLILLAFTRSTIHNEEELKKLINLHCLGTVPHSGGRKKNAKNSWPLISEGGDRFGFSESVRLLRIRVEKELRRQNGKVLLVSSAIPGEGKTTVSTNLALSLAQKGKRTLLIDLDLRSPSVNRIFSLPPSPGISDLLSGKTQADKLPVPLRSEGLFAVFAGTPVSNASELLGREELRTLIEGYRDCFDAIILDTPPCAMLADASEAAALADCALITIRQNFSTRDQILEGSQLLSDSHLPIIGCVLNGVRAGVISGGYGYSSRAGYGYGYGYGYGASRRKIAVNSPTEDGE